MAERATPVLAEQFLAVYLPAAQKQDLTREEVIAKLGMKEASFNSRLSSVNKAFREQYGRDLPKLKGSGGGGGKKTDWNAIDALVAEQLGIKPVDANAEGETADTEGADESVDQS